MKTRYYAAFVPDDKQILVIFPEFPGIVTWGKNEQDAAESAEEALELHLTGMIEDGEVLPSPADRETVQNMLATHCAETGIDCTEAVLQMVAAPDLDNTLVRINVSFRRSTLASIDKKASAAGMTRSGFLAAAAERFGSAL